MIVDALKRIKDNKGNKKEIFDKIEKLYNIKIEKNSSLHKTL